MEQILIIILFLYYLAQEKFMAEISQEKQTVENPC